MAAGTLDLLEYGLARPSRVPAPPAPWIPPSSPLTIFYSGTVNVYKDVPADKAHAIMLLLSNGEDRHNRSPDVSLVNINANGGASVSTTDCAMASPSSVGTSAMFKASTMHTASFAASTPPPQSPCPIAPREGKHQPMIGKRTQAELPFARKASLARFLEKRKDRVQTKINGSAEEEADGGESKKLKPSKDKPAPSH